MMDRKEDRWELNELRAEVSRLTAELAGNGVLIAEQNKLLAERQEWALHTSDIIRGLNAELTALQEEHKKLTLDYLARETEAFTLYEKITKIQEILK